MNKQDDTFVKATTQEFLYTPEEEYLYTEEGYIDPADYEQGVEMPNPWGVGSLAFSALMQFVVFYIPVCLFFMWVDYNEVETLPRILATLWIVGRILHFLVLIPGLKNVFRCVGAYFGAPDYVDPPMTKLCVAAIGNVCFVIGFILLTVGMWPF